MNSRTDTREFSAWGYLRVHPKRRGAWTPVFDLLKAAVELGCIEELSKQIDEIPDSSDLEQQRSKLALRVILALEQKDRERALELTDRLQQLLHESFRAKEKEYWPELHLVMRALHRHAAGQVIAGLITDLHEQRFSLGMRNVDKNHIVALAREYQAQLHNLSAPREAPLAGLKQWIPAARAIAKSRGIGSPNLRWTFDNERMLVIGSGRDEGFLFFRSPLVGYSRGGCLTSMGIGLIGAVLGMWLARTMNAPELFNLEIGGKQFPVVWSIIGASLFAALIGLASQRRRR